MNANTDPPRLARPGKRGCVIAALALAAASPSGCGTNFEDVLFQVVSAAGRTIVDTEKFVDVTLRDLESFVAAKNKGRTESLVGSPAGRTRADARKRRIRSLPERKA